MEHIQNGNNLLLDTLQQIWQNYLQACAAVAAAAADSNSDVELKKHWLELFLFYFRYADEHDLQEEDMKSFLNPISEEICSYLLEQVYSIINKSELFIPTSNKEKKTEDISDNISQQNHNFAQLILSAPSDCNKILALRTFLTHQLGQHLLEFLLRVDIKLIASPASLCNLCTKLFPNCPWSDEKEFTALKKPANVYDFMGNLHLYQKHKKRKTQASIADALNADTAAATDTHTSGTTPLRLHIDDHSNRLEEEFTAFKCASKTSDEIAYMLIELLSKCVANENVTATTTATATITRKIATITFSEKSMSMIALRFALDFLCEPLNDDAFGGGQQNVHVIKCELLRLIEQCLNNLFANNDDDNINEIPFQMIFNKLTTALEYHQKIMENSTCNQEESTAVDAINNIQIVYGLIYLTFGILHNIIFTYNNGIAANSELQNLYTVQFFEEKMFNVCIGAMKQLRRQNNDLYCPQLNRLFTSIFNILIKIVEYFSYYDQNMFGGDGNGAYSISGNAANSSNHKKRRKRIHLEQMHCACHNLPAARQQMWSCHLQGLLLNLLPNLSADLQERTIRYLLRAGTCCCHYTLDMFDRYLDVAAAVSGAYKKCCYKFIYRKILCTIFIRPLCVESSKRHQTIVCTKCDGKLKSMDFHTSLLQQYRAHVGRLCAATNATQALNVLLKHFKNISHLLSNDFASGILAEIVLPIFREFKNRAMTQTACVKTSTEPSNGTETPLLLKGLWNSAMAIRNYARASSPEEQQPVDEITKSPSPMSSHSQSSQSFKSSENRSRLHLHINENTTTGMSIAADLHDSKADYLKILHECLNIFVIYLSDIRLIKAFYNEENIQHLEDLLNESELIRGICDLIKIGIDNATFLGDNNQEQIALSRRLITLQLQSSDRAAKMFNHLLKRFSAMCNKTNLETPHQFCLEKQTNNIGTNDVNNVVDGDDGDNDIGALKPLDILQIVALQWSLNYELLKTSQYFYNEFAKIYSISIAADEDDEEKVDVEVISTQATKKPCNNDRLHYGDKTIMDIHRLSYNALSCFLISPPPRKKSTIIRQTSEEQYIYTFTPTLEGETNTNYISRTAFCKINDDDFSSSFETLFPKTSLAVAGLDDSGEMSTGETGYDRITQFYVDFAPHVETFLQKLQRQQLQREQQPMLNNIDIPLSNSGGVLLFDIGNQIKHTGSGIHKQHSQSCANVYIVGDDINITDPIFTSSLFAKDTTTISTAHERVVANGAGVIGKLFSMFGALFIGSHNEELPLNEELQRQEKIKAKFLYLYEPDGKCKRYALKLFEATMAICIKGYQNEEVEKMQKHLRKLKAIILSNATSNWQQYSEEQTRENIIIQALQTLLKVAEASHTLHEPGAVVSSSALTTIATATDDVATLPTVLPPIRPRVRSFNSTRAHLPAKNNTTNTSTPTIAHASVEADYISMRASIICADSDMEEDEELSDNTNEGNDDAVGDDESADDGYEADAEIPEISDSDAAIGSADFWNPFQPSSRYRSHILHEGLSRLVVDILMELSQLCTKNPVGWSKSLAQLANRLFVIRECLGGPLFLLCGFAPILSCNDERLKELQQAILELIVDLNTPDSLGQFFKILASQNPPIDILIKYMGYICSNSLKKMQPNVELEFPIIIDGKCISNSDRAISEQIDRVRNYHLCCHTTTPFTRSPCIIPITNARLWTNEGFTLSLWLQLKTTQTHKSSSSHQLLEDDARSVNDDFVKSHVVSIGTNQAMISIYINSNMNLVFEACRPNGVIQTTRSHMPGDATPQETNSPSLINNAQTNTEPTTTSSIITTRGAAHSQKIDRRLSNINNTLGNGANALTTTSPFRNAFKHTKLVILNSINNMNLFNGHTENNDNYYDVSSIELKQFRMCKNKWTHLAFGVDVHADHLDVIAYIDALEQHAITVPFRNVRNLTRTHNFQMLSIGDGIPMKSSPELNHPNSHTESRSTIDGCQMRMNISNLLLFNRKITVKEHFLNLTAMGPDFTEITLCQMGNWKPNYGYLNMHKMNSPNFGNFGETMKVLKESRILAYSAQEPDIVMGYNANSGGSSNSDLDNISYGRPLGLILYGELIQNRLPSLQTATILCGGLANLMYLFARVVEMCAHSETQYMALDLLLSVALSESQLYAEFLRNDYLNLISYVIRTERCTKDVHLLSSIINNACSQAVISRKSDVLRINHNSTAILVYPRLIVTILHRYADWHRSGAEQSDVLDTLLHCILALTREKHPHRDFNMEQFNRSGLINELLNLCKVYIVESPNPVFISKNAAQAMVNIMSVFAGSPPSPSLMDEIMKLLLLLHKPSECYITHDRSKFYFLLTSQLPVKEKSAALAAVNLIRDATPFRRNLNRDHGDQTSVTVNSGDSNRATPQVNRPKRPVRSGSSYKRVLNELEENLENVANCSRLNRNALRLVSPVAASKWRSKLKHNTSSCRSSISSKENDIATVLYRSSPTLSLRTSALNSPQQRIGKNRIRRKTALQGAHSSMALNYGERRLRYSESSIHSLASSLASTFNGNENEMLTTTSSPLQRRSKLLVKSDCYNSQGIVTLQEGLLVLLKDFLCLLPDNTVDDVLKHYIKVEFLLVLSNHSSCLVRVAIIRLLASLTKRLMQNELQAYSKSFYTQHLANQLCIYPTDLQMFESCAQWVTGLYGDLDMALACNTPIHIQHRFGLNALLAITTKIISFQGDYVVKCFVMLKRLYDTEPEEQQLLIEAGLLQCCVKTLFNLYVCTNSIEEMYNKTERSIVNLLAFVGQVALKSVGHINIVWDILNLLTFYQEKQPAVIVRSFRSLQAHLQLNWINMFFMQPHDDNHFKVYNKLPDTSLTAGETKTRLDLLIDRCSQFFTTFGSNYMPSDNEIQLFEFLVSYGIATNQRCNNFIAWGLQPTQPRALRVYIVNKLWSSCQQDFLPLIICDGKMIKSLLWLCLLEDLDEPIENLHVLCKHLGINESDSTWNLENELDRIKVNRINSSSKQKTLLQKTVHKYEQLALNCIESSMTTTRRVAELQNAERKLIMSHMKDYDDNYTYTKWLEIIRRMTHEGAPWYCKERAANSWEMDDTEGPSRIHIRLRRCHLEIDKRFLMEDYRCDSAAPADTSILNTPSPPAFSRLDTYTRPMDYLISSYDQHLSVALNSQILYNFPAKYIPIDLEIDGEMIITDHRLYFLATYRCKYFCVSCDIATITEIWLKRYQHKEQAFEIFLDTNQSLFFAMENQDDFKIMREVFCDKIITPPDQGKVLLITQQWREGLLTNWEYLMSLNQIAGRTYKDLMQYPVFPWILSNYTSEILDLTDANQFRKLERPIALQHDGSEQHFLTNYAYMHSNANLLGGIISHPYHYSSHYSNSGTVLHFMVRVPPYTRFFLRYQDNNFDLPDRTFHSLATTWGLASKDSPTDVKELIPEFFCLPEMFENFERFNFGCRQSGDRVEDVSLPPWCHRDPRLFTLIHRQALESELVRNNLHQWIDLIFGYKQQGESAIEAINVFHPATYASCLNTEIADPIERMAIKTMVKTYGQMPRQLFKSPHPSSKALNYCLPENDILPNVHGLRWGVYLGSPQLPTPMLGNIYKLHGAEYLVPFNNTNVIYGLPLRSCIMQGAEVDTFNVISWGYEDRIVRIQALNKVHAKPRNLLHNSAFDDITACGSDPNSNQLWFGHKSGRISVYKCSSADNNHRMGKSRQSYVRGLRLSYNSAFRKITTKSGIGSGSNMKTDADGEGGDTTPVSSQSASSINSAISDTQPHHHYHGNAVGGNGGNISGAGGCSVGTDLIWWGPTVLMRHTDEITCISLSVEFKIAVSTGRDGMAVIWDLNNWSYVRTIERPAEIHHSPITHIAISPTMGDIVTVHSIHQSANVSNGGANVNTAEDAAHTSSSSSGADECFEVTEENLDDFVNVMVDLNGRSILRLHTINARYVNHIVHEDRTLAVCYSYIKEGVGVNVIATAVEGGIVRLWSSWNLSFISEIVTGIANIRSITYSTHQHLVVLTKESHIQVWETDGLYGSSPKFPQIAYK